MVNESYPRLLGDVGGTNARFAWQSDHAAPPTEAATPARAERDALLSSATPCLAGHCKARPAAGAIAIDDPVVGTVSG